MAIAVSQKQIPKAQVETVPLQGMTACVPRDIFCEQTSLNQRLKKEFYTNSIINDAPKGLSRAYSSSNQDTKMRCDQQDAWNCTVWAVRPVGKPRYRLTSQQNEVMSLTKEAGNGAVPKTCEIYYFTLKKVIYEETAGTSNINYRRIWITCNFL